MHLGAIIVQKNLKNHENYFSTDMHEIKWDKKRVQHAEALYAVLQEYLASYTLPNFTDFLGMYGRVSKKEKQIFKD